MNIYLVLFLLVIIICYIYISFNNKIYIYKNKYLCNPYITFKNYKNQEKIYELLTKTWKKLAIKHNIKYSIFYGTLLGAARDGKPIPYDTDLDLIIDEKEASKLQYIKYKKKNLEFHLQRDWKLPIDDRTRYNCLRKKVKTQDTHCSFIIPIARLIYKPNKYCKFGSCVHLDIFTYKQLKKEIIIDHYNQKYKNKDMFPLKVCKFANTIVSCPNNIENILKIDYGEDLTPNHICKNKKWIKKNL